jgi:hypothetical protein
MADRVLMKDPMVKNRTGRDSLFGLRRAPQDIRASAAETAPSASVDLDLAALRLNARAGAAFAASQFLEQARMPPLLQNTGLGCRPPQMQDIVSPWLAYWARELSREVRAHRKLWEYAVVLQAFYEAGVLKPGGRALGFGVGDEPLPSYLASLDMHVVASDMAGCTDRDAIFQDRFLTEDAFDARVEVSDIDFGKLNDPSLRNFDACWSCSVVGALGAEHVAEEALIKSMDVLRPGGIAVHLMEFAFAPDLPQDRNDIFFPRSFFESLERAMNGRGHAMAPVSFGLGSHPLDAYVDIAALNVNDCAALEELWRFDPPAPHLKVALGNVMTTSFPVIVTCRD